MMELLKVHPTTTSKWVTYSGTHHLYLTAAVNSFHRELASLRPHGGFGVCVGGGGRGQGAGGGGGGGVPA
jgi:hypothetical protein